ncbi:23S rRNA (cytidine1920-2'-O)/16S rRNA (cytidine1409-2'-O)-methyltransferase [Prosthecobacter debontii]|uniref:23S rRNA (Cytidine1920-2'-O)/16S rRNA (Cytidine1409-2'-O)-methyltransferase n=1 Tax=Prosthecobacter debontii TaxID=48467 RepID=A0A1T4YSX8_9BACT|nr:TlyA family RNA methyltransferase [Prosthecobacter debontii]SKB04381.1 23S rRNA (cytidine1920-2'-O)/16S rRNA (cytidine1409-2'-O)-methyltransferase [Prosthecobacter debontii]
MARIRLDLALVQRGLSSSREQAKRLIMAGEVLLGEEIITKPGWLVRQDAPLRVKEMPRFVSRGGLKMEGALEHFGIDVTGWVAMDVGASTGGFTDCLLQRGAVKVYAFDVGTNQMVWKLRSDPRVVCRENFNVRHLQPMDVPELVDFIVADVSFISLTLVLPGALAVLKPGGQALVLVKPQFELSRDEVGKGGIVREPELHAKACSRLQSFIEKRPEFEWKGLVESSIQGTDGNREFLAWFARRPTSPE